MSSISGKEFLSDPDYAPTFYLAFEKKALLGYSVLGFGMYVFNVKSCNQA